MLSKVSIAVAIMCTLIGLIKMSKGINDGAKEAAEDINSSTEMTASVEEQTEVIIPEPGKGSDKIDVFVNVTAQKEDSGVVFDIETNLPDEAELMLSLSNGDYNTDNNFTAQTKVIINDGKASSEAFSEKGEPLIGDYDLSVSMSLPSLQSDAVREMIGEKGENMTGDLVKESSIGGSSVVRALFAISAGEEVTVTAEKDYSQTIFREEGEDEEEVTEEATVQETDTQANKEFLAEHDTDIVVAASMALQKFLDSDSYKMSLAPEKWTIAKFDETETTVIGITDITYNGQKGKYIYVGTLNIDSEGKVESAKPHYLEVNGQVLGDDGYCRDVFDKIKSIEN